MTLEIVGAGICVFIILVIFGVTRLFKMIETYEPIKICDICRTNLKEKTDKS